MIMKTILAADKIPTEKDICSFLDDGKEVEIWEEDGKIIMLC